MNPSPGMSDVLTQGIRIKAIAEYMPDYSNPAEDRYLYSYHITISNEGVKKSKLLSRHWIIINSHGKQEEVEGPGVIGETPELEPGESFEYTSFCPLDTNFGTMEGTYQMQEENGKTFDAQIGRFYLATSLTNTSK